MFANVIDNDVLMSYFSNPTDFVLEGNIHYTNYSEYYRFVRIPLESGEHYVEALYGQSYGRCVTDDFVQRMASILSSGQPPENVLEIVTIRAIFNKTMQCYFKMSGTNGHIPFKDIIVPAGLSGDLLLELSFKDNYIKNIFKSR